MFQKIISLFSSNFFEKKCFVLFSLSLIFFASQFGYSQNTTPPNAPETIALELNKPIEREFTGGSDKHGYQINLSANQYMILTVEQRGVDAAVRVSAADGKTIFDIDSETTAQKLEKVELVAESAGVYQIEIKPGLPKLHAGKYVVRLTEIRTATANEKSLDEARRKYHEARRLNDAGNFDRALELAVNSLEIREKISGANDADAAASMLVVSRLYLIKNNLAQAEVFVRRAMETSAKISSADSLSYADAISVLARIRHSQTDYADAETLNQQALAVREKAAGADSLAAADSAQNLALLYRATNDYAKAEKNFTKALSIYEKLLGDNRFETGLLLNNFGLFYYGAGDFDQALALLRRSLAVKEKIFAPNHRQIGIAFNNLGLVAWKKKDYENAKVYYQRALIIFEAVNGAESDGVANILSNLGIIYKESDGNPAKAEEYYKRALAINEKIFGENHQTTANALSSLSILYRTLGDLDRAEKFQLRAHAIYEKVLGEYNNYTLLSLGSLIRIYAAKGDVNRAVEYMKRLSAIHGKTIPLNLRIGSERQKIAYYRQTSRFDNLITLHAELARDDAAMRDLAVTTILQHKGRVLDAVSENLSALRQRFDAEDQTLLDNLSDVNSRLSKVILSSRQKISAEEQQKQIETLEAEREKLESEISRRSAGFYESSQPVTLDAVRNAIPNDAALIEYAVYRPFRWKAGDDQPDKGEPRYIAYVVRREGETQWKDLGEAKSIDAAISELRQALRDPQRRDIKKLARAADAKIMQPVRALLGDAKHLLVSPDGELNLIPFEALVDEKERYQIENYSFNYLTGGRDLLRMQIARTSKSKFLLIADPSFGAPAAERRGAARDSSDAYFAPLGGTVQEARVIQKLFPEATLVSGAEATEAALKKTVAPRLLHIATHGFFFAEADENNSQTAVRGSNAGGAVENPLAHSGLALAGANRRESAGDDGILTALEASGLNLWGTKLVVLSACDTGIGEVKNGEGVYGLRRAFTLAGTESLVMSLWSVSDQVTRELMTDYYKNLKGGTGRGASLRRVQLEMLKKNNRRHPFYWAAFIQSGEWANLDGKR